MPTSTALIFILPEILSVFVQVFSFCVGLFPYWDFECDILQPWVALLNCLNIIEKFRKD